MDCYHDVWLPFLVLPTTLTAVQIIGNALVGVVFTRNAISVVVLFALTPWVSAMGLRDLHILIGVLSFVILLLPVALLIWGKKARIATARSYMEMARRQPTRRDV
ncbi:MAG TPA: hypothetical protein PLE48_10035 [Thiobacillus sp.]|nr:hypothetical protein [Thiobacillus sp.]